MPHGIALIGLGKIARDQHLPAIAGSDLFTLAATVDPISSGVTGVPHFKDLAELLETAPPLDAVVLCTPPQARFELAMAALYQKMHVFLEKPPSVTIAEAEILRDTAWRQGVTLFAGWHSRFAAGVEPARAWLKERQIKSVSVVWREDVRIWHPGQNWIWEPGGLGVFDPGINALSIITHILPRQIYVTCSTLTFPSNRAAPIAADLAFLDSAGIEIKMDLDFRQVGPQTWDIVVETDEGMLVLSSGGSDLTLPSGVVRADDQEYQKLYARFGWLIGNGQTDFDTMPLQLVADAFITGRCAVAEPFHF